MTTTQLFIALLGSFIAVNGILIGVLIKCLDAKIDSVKGEIKPLKQQVDMPPARKIALTTTPPTSNMLVQYMVSHEGRLGTLEERTKKL